MTTRPGHYEYITDGNEIYRQSFATIRAETDLSHLSDDEATVAVRMIHAAGQTSLIDDIEFSPHCVTKARAALDAGAPIITDVTMVATGITASRLPGNNAVMCLLGHENTRDLAAKLATTRSAAAVELWREHCANAVIAIGNAPTALFHLLQKLADDPDYPRPAAIIGCPVGFIGAAESKQALSQDAAALGVEFVTVHGRRGGSAITSAAVNALANRREIMPR
ncbi:precorrin-8X methylmutase [Corynebacterium choanae]|uniref:Precorrin-8X methylmutase n=1 Tax=Corynebacterium choanae TaxID=1862358 RepID=A0A3G6JAP5_9CORY|nr:precorrin-8X methylmutase [Corynebacterium choanae]AZA13550.1 Precorrin-8X methylmutase [Corynebacterium choanae]